MLDRDDPEQAIADWIYSLPCQVIVSADPAREFRKDRARAGSVRRRAKLHPHPLLRQKPSRGDGASANVCPLSRAKRPGTRSTPRTSRKTAADSFTAKFFIRANDLR